MGACVLSGLQRKPNAPHKQLSGFSVPFQGYFTAVLLTWCWLKHSSFKSNLNTGNKAQQVLLRAALGTFTARKLFELMIYNALLPDTASGAPCPLLLCWVWICNVSVAKPADISPVSTFNIQLPIPWAAPEASPVILQIPAQQMWQLFHWGDFSPVPVMLILGL